MTTGLPINAPPEWVVAGLADLADFITKGTTPTTLGFPWADSGILFLRSECVGEGGFTERGSQRISTEAHKALARSEIKGGDLLITITGNVGRVCMFPSGMGQANINQHIARVRIVDKRADRCFVAHVLATPEYRRYFERIITGLAYPQLSLKQIRETLVPLPPLLEQRRIATILSSVDATIEKTESVVEQLQVVKKAMMQELLTRGLPGRHTRFKKTEIGEVPEDWAVVALGSVAKVERGKFAHRPRNDPAFYDGPYPFVQTGDVAGCDGRIATYSQTLNDRGLAVSRMFPAGTILITIAANIGDTAIAAFEVAFPDSLVGIITGEEVDNRFLELALRLRKKELEDAAPQNAQKNINLQVLRPLPVPLPSLREQVEIADSVDSVAERIRAEHRFLDELRTTKSSLMNVLLTGEVRVTPNETIP